MKRIIIFSAIALSAISALSSCENDPLKDVPESTVYLSTGVTPANEVSYVVIKDAVFGGETVVGSKEVSFKLLSTDPVGADVTAVLKVDESLLSAGETLLPESAYTIGNATATILNGESESAEAYTLTLSPEAVSGQGNFTLPLSIEITAGKAVLSNTLAVVKVRLSESSINSEFVPQNSKRVANDRFSYGAYVDEYGMPYGGYDYTDYAMGPGCAFDQDATTEWYSYAVETEAEAASDYSYYYGVIEEVKFNEPVALKGLVVSANSASDYYPWRARRISLMFKYEGENDYVWDKPYGDGNLYDDSWNVVGVDENEDEKMHTYCPILASDIPSIPDYKPSPADFLITDANYSNFTIDLSDKLGGKKVQSVLIIPAKLECYQDGWNDTLQDFNYTYFYDIWYGTVVSEISFFEAE